MKETYEVRCPRHICVVDPRYLQKYSGERLKELKVDCNPPGWFQARVVLQEEPHELYPDMQVKMMEIFMAPKETMETYLLDMIYDSQSFSVKKICVDTAEYLMRVDEKENLIHTGGDGYWGDYQEVFRNKGEKRILDAAIVTLVMPPHQDMQYMRNVLHSLFEDVMPIANVEAEEEGVMEQGAEETKETMDTGMSEPQL